MFLLLYMLCSHAGPLHYFANTPCFLTGVTGFVGKVLLEKILRSAPGPAPIYVLIRPRRDIDAQVTLTIYEVNRTLTITLTLTLTIYEVSLTSVRPYMQGTHLYPYTSTLNAESVDTDDEREQVLHTTS